MVTDLSVGLMQVFEYYGVRTDIGLGGFSKMKRLSQEDRNVALLRG